MILSGEVKTPNNELAYQDYRKGMKYKEIAEKYGVTINTVKSWKTRYKWSKDGKKSVHTKTKKVCTQKSNESNAKKEAIAEAVGQVIENAELTDKQRLIDIPEIKEFGDMKLCAAGGEIGLDESFLYDYDANYTIIVPVEIDGKETARVIAPYTEAELDKRQRRNSRKHGIL